MQTQTLAEVSQKTIKTEENKTTPDYCVSTDPGADQPLISEWLICFLGS